MKTKKWLAALLAVAMTASALPAVDGMDVLHTTATSSISSNSTYFYDQLKGSDYQKFYQAMKKMATEGFFEKGEDLDLVKEGYFTSDEVKAFSNGKENVLNVYGAARDAFTFDHPDIFYVDFSALSIRITVKGGKYQLILGKGRRDTYWTENFTTAGQVSTAIQTYNT